MKNNYQSQNRFPVKQIPPSTYVASSSQESRCQEIAIALGESDMRYILARLHQLGLQEIEYAFGVVKEMMREKTINNPRRYFNKILTTRINALTCIKESPDVSPRRLL